MTDKTTPKPTPPLPDLAELFGDKAVLQPDGKSLFAGNPPAAPSDKDKNDTKNLFKARSAFPVATRIGLTAILVYLALLTAALVYLTYRPAVVKVDAESITLPNLPNAASAAAQPTAQQTADWLTRCASADQIPQPILDYLQLSKTDAATLEQAASLELAEKYYQNKQYYRAAFVYARLRSRLERRDRLQQALADWLSLQMALCLQKTCEQPLIGQLFTEALASTSPAVRALAQYNLAFIQNHNCNFLDACQRAYAALTMLKAVETHLPATVESDCYFVALEALTRYVMSASGYPNQLPAAVWADHLPVYSPAVTDQQQLAAMLCEASEQMVGAALSPQIVYQPHQPVGQQWSAFAWDAPLREILKRYATQAGIQLELTLLNSAVGDRKVSAFFPQTDRHWLAETVVGSAGLFWQLDGDTGRLIDAAGFTQLNDWRSQLAHYIIAGWQKFMLRYRGDHRYANAHFALGLLHNLLGQDAAALGEYKLLATQFPNHPLAPFGLMNASRIRTALGDYKGAQADLNELLIRYPNFAQMDEALLQLAEATLHSGDIDQAQQMFLRIYYLNVADAARRRTLAGLGRCAFQQGRFADAVKWFEQLRQMPNADKDLSWPECALMLGKAYHQLGQFSQAAAALRSALLPRMEVGQYLPIILSLAESELKQDNYLAALNLLESVPEERLSQEQAVQWLLARSAVYRAMGVPTVAISLLRRKMEFIAESDLRALMGLELAECYLSNQELTPARKELVEAMPYLPTGYKTFQAALRLAQIAAQEKRYTQAEAYCLEALRMGVEDADQRQAFYQTLGSIYQAQNAPQRAALAYAGIIDSAWREDSQ